MSLWTLLSLKTGYPKSNGESQLFPLTTVYGYPFSDTPRYQTKWLVCHGLSSYIQYSHGVWQLLIAVLVLLEPFKSFNTHGWLVVISQNTSPWCIYIYIYVSMYLCIYVCMYLCMYVYMYIYMYVSMYVCIYVCMYVCEYVYIYIYQYSLYIYISIKNIYIYNIIFCYIRWLQPCQTQPFQYVPSMVFGSAHPWWMSIFWDPRTPRDAPSPLNALPRCSEVGYHVTGYIAVNFDVEKPSFIDPWKHGETIGFLHLYESI